METSAIDELYGDLDQDRYDSGLNYDEDSVDIYSGLEDSPKSKGKIGKVQTFFSPQRLKDSMDLYEELITKEQVEKEATYSELKVKFDAAQNQVQELLAKLQQIETKNSSLLKENMLLKKNICALIKTAKMEIIRKDEEIRKLSNRSNRGIFHISSLDRSPSSINLSGPSRGSQDFRGVVGSRSVNKPDESSVLHDTSSSVGLTQRCTKSNAENSLKRHEINLSFVPHAPNSKPAQSGQLSQSKDGVNMGSETAPEITRTCKDGRDGGKENLIRHSSRPSSSSLDLKQQDLLEKPQSNLDNNRAKKAQSNTRSASSEVQPQQDDPVIPRRSGFSSSPASYTQLPSSSRCYSQSSKGPSRMDTEILDRKEEFQHKQREEKQSEKLETSRKGSFAELASSLDRSTKIKGTREHHRKEERRLEDISILEKRKTSDRIKESESKKMQESEGKIQQDGSSSRGDKKSADSDTRSEHVRRSAKESDKDSKMPKEVVERRPKEGRERSRGDVPVSRRNASPVKTDQRKKHEKRKFSKTEEELSRCKASSSRDHSRGAEGSTEEAASSRDHSRGAEGSTEEAASSRDHSRGAEGSTEEAASSRDDSRGAQISIQKHLLRTKDSSCSNDFRGTQISTDEQLSKSKGSSSRDGSRSGKSCADKEFSSRDESRGAEGSTEEAVSIHDDSRGAQSSIEKHVPRSKASSCNNDFRGTQISTDEQLSKSKGSSSRGGSRSGKSCADEAARSRVDSRGAQSSSKEPFSRCKASNRCEDSRSGRSSTEKQLSKSKTSSTQGDSRTSRDTTEEELSRRKASDSFEISRRCKNSSEKKFSMGKSSSSHDGSRSDKRSFEEQLPRSRVSLSRNSSKGVESSASHASHSSFDKGASTDSEKGRSKGDRGSKKSSRSSSSDKSKTGRDHDVSESSETDCQSTKRKSPVMTSSSDGPSMLLEESPKRKLSFMETLNLTLSPIKNQNLLQDSGRPEEAIVSNSVGKPSFELGEEFCVIDEAENTQESVEAMETAALPRDPRNTSPQCSQGHDVPTVSTELPTCQDKKVMEQEPDLNSLPGDLSAKAEISDKQSMDSEMQEMEIITEGKDVAELATNIHPTLPQSVPGKTVLSVFPLPEESEPVDGPVSLGNLGLNDPIVVEKQITSSLNAVIQVDKPDSAPFVHSNSVEVNTFSKSFSGSDTSASLEVASSTVIVDVNLQGKTACGETQTVTNIKTSGGLKKLTESLKKSSEETLSIGSTVREDIIPCEQIGSSEPDSTEDEMNNLKPSGSVFSQHDEDSMMLTLSNIKVFPEAISPLTSPVRQIKKVQQKERPVREQHVKSLSKDFSISSSFCTIDKATVQMDMNKENKRPDLPVTPSTALEQEALTSSATQDSLEEGEIISESDEERTLVIQSPPVRKRSSSRIHPSPKSPGLKKTNKTKTAVTPNRSEQGQNRTSTDSPTSNKRRFKLVTVSSKSSISSTSEFMNKLTYIRAELRRKYMKLHRNVTKTAFHGIIDMSLASFTEFVDTVNFHKFCSQEKEIKPRLNKIIANVMSKVSNNGIVNRIFEQRAEDLKQKLWTFVDGQFDFLFKEVKAALKSVSNPSRIKTPNPRETEEGSIAVCKIQRKEPLSMAENATHTNQTTTSHCLPFKGRGLGSSGKNIKATMEMADEQPTIPPSAVSFSEKPFQETITVQEQTCTLARRLSHNASIQDRSDFEILTEQQASSLTFNLVTDSQMGDIFRCLLQGSDLEAGVSMGDNQNWQFNTPRKEGMSAESLIGVMTPSKMVTPFKLGMTWPPISPYKFTSPNSKFQMSVNPAILDENCLLEVPSNALSNQAVSALTSVNSHKSYSILAEDLAVSLTIPSPLKSEDHLSFLNPANVKMLSTPSSVISAHYSEDALLDGEDASVQDIHLSLDTDNSSCTSSTSGPWEPQTSAIFQVKPNLPMQAEVMERSNDHFIVRIRHAGVHEDPALGEKEPLLEEQSRDKTSAFEDGALSMAAQPLEASVCQSEPQVSTKGALFNSVFEGDNQAGSSQHNENHTEQATVNPDVSWDTTSTDPPISLASADHKNGIGIDSLPECHKKDRKRKKHHSGSRVKRSRRERSQDELEKERPKKRSKSSKEKTHKIHSQKSPSPQLSPNSMSAKNIIRKKGEVVVTWTREEDRDILVELKLKGLSSKTFATLSSKLRKSQGQIEERVNQLMKLLKKKEKMES